MSTSKVTGLLSGLLLLSSQISGGQAYAAPSYDVMARSTSFEGETPLKNLVARTPKRGGYSSAGSSSAGPSSAGSKPSGSGGLSSLISKPRGSKLDFAGNVVGAAGNIIPALIPPQQPQQPQIPAPVPPPAAGQPPVQKRSLERRALEKLYMAAALYDQPLHKRSASYEKRDLDELDLMDWLEVRDLDELDLEPREAFKLPHSLPHSRGSKLDFAGNVIGAVGNIAPAFIPPPQQAVPPAAAGQQYPAQQMPQQMPPPAFKRSLHYEDLSEDY